jgi:hypothetical protein
LPATFLHPLINFITVYVVQCVHVTFTCIDYTTEWFCDVGMFSKSSGINNAWLCPDARLISKIKLLNMTEIRVKRSDGFCQCTSNPVHTHSSIHLELITWSISPKLSASEIRL